MFKGKLNNGDIVLGLSAENIRRMQNKEPIIFNLKTLELEDRNVIIMFGETESTIYEELIDLIDLKTTKTNL
jgi:hypothetical protein